MVGTSAVVSKAVVIVDPWSTGRVLAEEFMARDMPVVAVWSNEEFARESDKFFTNLICENKESLIEDLKALDIEFIAIIPGAESGVILADELAFDFQTRMNPFDLSIARRNKYIMGETIRAAGVRAVEQTIASTWEQVDQFLTEWNPSPYKVIVKPNQSAGSDDVFLCTSREKVKEAFDHINGAINHLGFVNEGVLIQEFLEGPEIVIDTISMDGQHKVCAIWQYDKRTANDQFNVYFGMMPRVVESEIEHDLVEYIFSVLDALKFENGPGHAELKITPRGPVLIEIGSRCHGGEGQWQVLSDRAFGWNQISRTAEMYVTPEAFDNYPPFPSEMLQYCVNLDFVSYSDGIVVDIPGEKILQALPSCHRIRWEVRRGGKIMKTTDLFTSPGQAQLIHDSREQVEEDYNRMHELMLDGFFVVRPAEKEAEYESQGEPQESVRA